MANEDMTREDKDEDKKKKASHQGNDFFRDESQGDEAGGEGEGRDEM